MKTPYKPNAEAVVPAWDRQSPKSHGYKTMVVGSRSPGLAMVKLGPKTITAHLPQGARAKARSSPPATFNSLMEPLGHREFHYLKPPQKLSRQWGAPQFIWGRARPGSQVVDQALR